eukprot:JP440789.1.p2 GENE.JP440789.1~~JP440789.1.p2  ORF type:complete len:78 (+),score=25.85 JP440789.1:1-234(+)
MGQQQQQQQDQEGQEAQEFSDCLEQPEEVEEEKELSADDLQLVAYLTTEMGFEVDVKKAPVSSWNGSMDAALAYLLA